MGPNPDYSLPAEIEELVKVSENLVKKQAPRPPLLNRSGMGKSASATQSKADSSETAIPKPPSANSKTSKDNKLKQEFDQNWETYQAALEKPSRMSGPSRFLSIPEWKTIKNQGRAVMPFLVNLLCNHATNWVTVILGIRDFDPQGVVGDDFKTKRAYVIEKHVEKYKSISAKIDLFSTQKGQLQQAGLQGSSLVSQLLSESVSQQIIADGIDAVPHILDVYSKEYQQDDEVYIEMLKQIHAAQIQDVDSNGPAVTFESWLEQYLQPQIDQEAVQQL